MSMTYVCPHCGSVLSGEYDERESYTSHICNCGLFINEYEGGELSIIDDHRVNAESFRDPTKVIVSLYLDDAVTETTAYEVQLDHAATPEDYKHYAYLGYTVASQLYKMHCEAAIEADSAALWREAISKDPSIVTEAPETGDIDWSEVGPRAVFGMINALYALKREQGVDDSDADRQSDEETCELTGLTVGQLAELYSVGTAKSL